MNHHIPPVFLADASFQQSHDAEPLSHSRRAAFDVMFSWPTLEPHCSAWPKSPHMHHWPMAVTDRETKRGLNAWVEDSERGQAYVHPVGA